MTFKWDNFSRHFADLSGRPIHYADIMASHSCFGCCFDFLGCFPGLLSIAKIPLASLMCGKSCGFMTEMGTLTVSIAFQANTLAAH
jgi:hypothetical protein